MLKISGLSARQVPAIKQICLLSNPVDLSLVVQQQLCRLAAQSGDWGLIIEQISEIEH